MCPLQQGQGQLSAEAIKHESSNLSVNPIESPIIPTVVTTDGAGGLAERELQDLQSAENQFKWYVLYVSPRSEKKVRDLLLKANYEAYVASHEELHVWGRGQRKKVEAVVITGVVFVKIAESQMEAVRHFPLVYSFMMDPARRGSKENLRTFAIVPDAQMRMLKAMLGQQDYDVDFATQFSVGEHVRIAGFEGYDEIAQIVKLPKDRSTYVGVRVGFLGCAYMKVPIARIIKIKL